MVRGNRLLSLSTHDSNVDGAVWMLFSLVIWTKYSFISISVNSGNHFFFSERALYFAFHLFINIPFMLKTVHVCEVFSHYCGTSHSCLLGYWSACKDYQGKNGTVNRIREICRIYLYLFPVFSIKSVKDDKVNDLSMSRFIQAWVCHSTLCQVNNKTQGEFRT